MAAFDSAFDGALDSAFASHVSNILGPGPGRRRRFRYDVSARLGRWRVTAWGRGPRRGAAGANTSLVCARHRAVWDAVTNFAATLGEYVIVISKKEIVCTYVPYCRRARVPHASYTHSCSRVQAERSATF